MIFPRFRKPPVTASSRTTTAIIGLSLAAVAVAIYLSPEKTPAAPVAVDRPVLLADAGGSTHATASAAPSASASRRALAHETTPTHHAPTTTAASSATGRHSTSAAPIIRVVHDGGRTEVIVERKPGTTVTRTRTVTITPATKIAHCWDFQYQQDAQAAYVANLSDPGGLDGAVGAHNGDGLACTQLPVDPNRAPSIPVDAYTPPPPAEKAALMAPGKRYFGVTEDGLPGDSTLLAALSDKVGKAPSEIGWFSYWNNGFDADKVRAAWSHGALPMITWMSVPSNSKATDYATYSLTNIINGRFDHYLLQYAGSVVATGLPVAIRFDHEMNGNWYPWSPGLPANRPAAGQANLYVQAWQHVHDLFASVGANSNVIWTWAPVRVDAVNPHSTVSGYKYETTLAEDYPGDDYVDWVGTSAYQYKPADGWSYETTFRKTLTGLAQVAPAKPVFIAETGATETVGAVDHAADKASWTAQTLAALATERNVIGFSWFNNTVNNVHTVDGIAIQTDWRLDSSAPALSAFATGIANPVFASGIRPDLGKA